MSSKSTASKFNVFVIFLALAAAFVFACSKAPPTRQISGQVFVVTRGKASVKMALVEVRLYEARVLEEYFKSSAPRVAAAIERAEGLSAEASTAAFNAEMNEEALRNTSYKAAGEIWFDVALAQLKIAKIEAKEAREISDMANALVQVARSAMLYFAELPKQQIAVTKTDADGNFSFSVPSGRKGLALAATTERSVGLGEEVYFWAVKVPDADDAKIISLTNDNECSADTSASLLHTIDLDSHATKALTVSTDALKDRLRNFIATISADSPTAQPSAVAQKQPVTPSTPMPQFEPLPPPEFVRLKEDFTLIDAKGKEIKTLDAGKRLRVVSRSTDRITVDYLGQNFSIPLNVTEPSK
jgi:DNA uptake protein ComE-like DNA-binding protein